MQQRGDWNAGARLGQRPSPHLLARLLLEFCPSFNPLPTPHGGVAELSKPGGGDHLLSRGGGVQIPLPSMPHAHSACLGCQVGVSGDWGHRIPPPANSLQGSGGSPELRPGLWPQATLQSLGTSLIPTHSFNTAVLLSTSHIARPPSSPPDAPPSLPALSSSPSPTQTLCPLCPGEEGTSWGR